MYPHSDYTFVSCLLLFAFCTHSDRKSVHTTRTEGVFDSPSALTRTHGRTSGACAHAVPVSLVLLAIYLAATGHIDAETTRRQTPRFVRRHSARRARVAWSVKTELVCVEVREGEERKKLREDGHIHFGSRLRLRCTSRVLIKRGKRVDRNRTRFHIDVFVHSRKIDCLGNDEMRRDKMVVTKMGSEPIRPTYSPLNRLILGYPAFIPIFQPPFQDNTIVTHLGSGKSREAVNREKKKIIENICNL